MIRSFIPRRRGFFSTLFVFVCIAALAALLSSCAPEPAAAPPSTEPPPTTPSPEPVTPSPTPSTPEPEPEPEPELEPEPEREPLTALPVRMRIPALSADSEIQGTGADGNGTMEVVPAANIISWYKGSAIPGNDGNSFLAGHNRWGGVNGPLLELDTLNIGDEMEIDYADGSTLTFKLESVFVYALATIPSDLIMDPGGDARVTVITCKAPYNPKIGTSDNRIIAIFKEESVFVLPDPPIEPFPIREA